MTKLSKILIGTLILQVLLIILVNLPGQDMRQFQSDEKILSLDFETLTKIIIEAKDETPLILQKSGNEWQLPSRYNIRVDQKKLENFIIRLSNINKGWPVGKTKVASKQLKVRDDLFEKKITLFKEDESKIELFLGTSPSFRKLHARLGGSDLTYAVPFNAYEASVNADEWMDKSYTQIEKEDVLALEMPTFRLNYVEGIFKPDDLSEEEEVRLNSINSFLNQVLHINFEEVLGLEDKPEYKQKTPLLEFTLYTKENEALVYRISGPVEKDSYVLKISKYPFFFKIRANLVEKIREINRDQLVKKKDEVDEEEDLPDIG